MSYAVKEIYYTLQGEGAQCGRAAVFCRFAGCNLWSGHEVDRESAVCQFCDTNFVGTDGAGGGDFASAEALASRIAQAWPRAARPDAGGPAKLSPLVVFTGGEPLLQLDADVIAALHAHGFEVAVETNGTLTPPAGIDWMCVSPKAGAVLRVTAGDERKLIYPQPGALPEDFERLAFEHFYLQPMDGPCLAENTRQAVAYCLAHPQWRISLQTHKLLGIP
ncbi:MAG: 7-carboxy-7-deazaguanine synthase [Planctomycetes bacterium]|nr:7-carboxy-7-deazaguanine synthase [Planctomycetota bacterium]